MAGFLLIHFYPPTTHNQFAEEAGAILHSRQGPDVLSLGELLGYLTVALWLLHRKSGKAGKGLATTGVVFGCVASIGSFLYFWNLPDFDAYPRPLEQTAISAVRNLITAQITYSATTGRDSYAPDLKALQDAELIDEFLGSGAKDGYTFLMTVGPIDEQGQITTFGLIARPVEYGVSGWANFFSDESGVIRYTIEDRPSTAKDPPL